MKRRTEDNCKGSALNLVIDPATARFIVNKELNLSEFIVNKEVMWKKNPTVTIVKKVKEIYKLFVLKSHKIAADRSPYVQRFSEIFIFVTDI